jgi:hypothetical protein
VSRVFLVIAMVVSLWPVGFIAVSAATDSSTESASQPTGAPSPAETTPSADANDGSIPDAGSETSPPEPDLTAYRALRRRADSLLKQLDASSAYRGVVDAQLARRAQHLAAAYGDWDRANGELDPGLHRLAGAERRIAQRLAAFAGAPTQRRLDRFKAAIRQFNRTLRAVQG